MRKLEPSIYLRKNWPAVLKLDSFEEGKNNDIVDLRKANDKLTAQLEQAKLNLAVLLK